MASTEQLKICCFLSLFVATSSLESGHQEGNYFEEALPTLQSQLQSQGFAIGSALNGDVLRSMAHGVNFLGETFHYSGGFFEREPEYGDGIYDVGISNASAQIPPHNEMGSAPRAPRYIIFGCVEPATGGDTVLVDGHKVFEALPRHMQELAKKRKVRTSLRWDDSTIVANTTSWRTSLSNVGNVRDAHRVAQELGYYPTWDGANRSVFAAFDYAPVVTHPTSGKPALFEQIVTSHGVSLYNDDPMEEGRAYIDRLHHSWWSPNSTTSKHEIYERKDEIDIAFVDALRDLEMKVSITIPAKKGQILIVDNVWHKHGRLPFTGERQMRVIMKGAYRGTPQPFSKKASYRGATTANAKPVSPIVSPYSDAYSQNIRKTKVELAASYRLFDKHKLNEGVWNHLTVAVNDRFDEFLVPRKGLSWSLMKPEDMLLVDSKGNVLAGDGTSDDVDVSALTIHAAVHKACGANGKAVFHLHMPWSTTMCAMKPEHGGRLLQVHQNCARFYNAVAYDDRFNGFSESFEEGETLARRFREAGSLGDQCSRTRTLFLANHGVIIVAPSVAAAWDDSFYLERASQLQVQALMAVGGDVSKLKLISDDIAEVTYQQTVGQSAGVGYADMHLAAGLAELRQADPTFGIASEEPEEDFVCSRCAVN